MQTTTRQRFMSEASTRGGGGDKAEIIKKLNENI